MINSNVIPFPMDYVTKDVFLLIKDFVNDYYHKAGGNPAGVEETKEETMKQMVRHYNIIRNGPDGNEYSTEALIGLAMVRVEIRNINKRRFYNG